MNCVTAPQNDETDCRPHGKENRQNDPTSPLTENDPCEQELDDSQQGEKRSTQEIRFQGL